MKKTLLFLLLFGAGLGALYLLQERDQEAREERAPTEMESEPEDSGPVLAAEGVPADAASEEVSPSGATEEVPLPNPPAVSPTSESAVEATTTGQTGINPDEVTDVQIGDDPNETIAIVLKGQHDFLVFETEAQADERIQKTGGDPNDRTKKKRYEYSGRLIPKGQGRFDVESMNVRVFDVEGQVSMQFDSDLAHLELEFDENRQPRISETKPAVLENVELTLFSGAPIVPMTFHVPRLEWMIIDETFTSEDRVQLDAPGLDAAGTGLRIVSRKGAEEIVLIRDATNKINLEDGLRAELETTGLGSLVYRNLGSRTEPRLELEMRDGARLLLEGDRTIEAKTLTVVGMRPPLADRDSETDAAKEPFRLEEARAAGDVTMRGKEGVFQAEETLLDFDLDGAPYSARLIGRPRGHLRLEALRSSEKAGDTRAHFDGNGPLVLRLGEQATVDFEGPANVELTKPPVRIEARESMNGAYDEALGRQVFNAHGDVKVTHAERGTLQGVAVRVEREEKGDAGGDPLDALVRFLVEGPSRFRGTTQKGRTVEIDSGSSLQMIADGESLTVPYAEDIALRYGSKAEDLIGLRAGLLQDLDVDTRRFEATSGVDFEMDGQEGSGQGQADSLIAFSDTEVELRGTSSEPAHLEYVPLDRGDSPDRFVADANRLTVRRDQGFVADGAVQMTGGAGASDLVLRSTRAELTIEPLPTNSSAGTSAGAAQSVRDFTLEADDVERMALTRNEQILGLTASRVVVSGIVRGSILEESSGSGGADENGPPPIEPFHLLSEGAVVLDLEVESSEIAPELEGLAKIFGNGALFTMDASGDGMLTPTEGGRVQARGRIAGDEVPFELDAAWIQTHADRLEAGDPVLSIARLPGAADEKPLDLVVRAETLETTADEVRFVGAVHVDGNFGDEDNLVVDSATLRLFTEVDDFNKKVPVVVADGGYVALLNGDIESEGETLRYESGKVMLLGNIARVVGPEFAWESTRLELDLKTEMVETGPGTIVPLPKLDKNGVLQEPEWSISYDSLKPFPREDVTILALRDSVITSQGVQLSSNWSLIWIDSEEWGKRGSNFMQRSSEDADSLRIDQVDSDSSAPKDEGPQNLFSMFETSAISKIINEVYVEGEVEYVEDEKRVRAEAVYVDLFDGHGWVQGADLRLPINIQNKDSYLHVQAEWLRHSRDGSLRADSATLTTCEFDGPHYIIETGDLRLDPFLDDEGGQAYSFAAKDNLIRTSSGVVLPLPSLGVSQDSRGNFIDPEVGGFDLPNLRIADTARFGTTLAAGAAAPLGVIGFGIAKFVGKPLGLDLPSIDGRWRFQGSYLGSRGILGGVGLEITEGQRFWARTNVDGIFDRGEDRGLVRVDEDDRSSFRGWYRGVSRFYPKVDENGEPETDEWFDLRFSVHNDAGVQAEFFEGDFLRYEERENYLHWRRAQDEYYYDASARVRLDTELTQIEELPKVGFQRGRTPIGKILGSPVLYSTEADAGYFRRREGDVEDGFGGILGDREVARFDNEHRFEMPLDFGESGVRFTPFVAGRATLWSEDRDRDSDPTRLAAFAGGEFSSTLFKRFEGGWLHSISPTVSYREDLAVEEHGGNPVRFDEVENSVEGRAVELGLRSLLRNAKSDRFFDAEARAIWTEDSPLRERGWAGDTLSQFRYDIGGVPFGFTHDGRYNLDNGDTLYSRSFIGVEPLEKLGIETGYHSGRDEINDRLYEAASLAVRLRATEKWEFEFRQTYDLQEEDDLVSRGVVRRLGHDLVLEIELSNRAGEGTSFSIGLNPRLTWRRSSLGILDNFRRRKGYY